MAKRTGADAGPFLFNGFNLLPDLTGFSHKETAITEETTPLGTSWASHTFAGVRTVELSHQGFYDDRTAGVVAALATAPGTSGVLTYGVEGNATNARFYGWDGALSVDFSVQMTRNELHKAEANYRPQGRLDYGRIIHPLTGRTASGNTTGNAIDFGASNTSGAAGYLQVNSMTTAVGVTAFVVDIFHSSDNLTFTSYAAFGAVTATAPSATRINSTVTIERWVAARWQGSSGAAFTASATFLVGVAPR